MDFHSYFAYFCLCCLFFSLIFQLCESLEELQNMNGKLRNEGQGIWALLGRIIGQVGWFFVPLYRNKTAEQVFQE